MISYVYIHIKDKSSSGKNGEIKYQRLLFKPQFIIHDHHI